MTKDVAALVKLCLVLNVFNFDNIVKLQCAEKCLAVIQKLI